MKYSLKLADVCLHIDVPYTIHQSDSTKEFMYPLLQAKECDLKVEILPVEELPVRADVCFQEPRRTYVGTGGNGGTFFSSHPGEPPYAYVSRSKGHINCEYLPGNEQYMNYGRNLVTLIDIEATLLDFAALILHASLLRWENRGIIFSAPSGTGKSTQAELWKQYLGADILNGDRAALRKKDDTWRAYGLPYAGTSGIYRNESTPLTAIIALRQAKNNRIRRISGAEAFRYLYPETMIHRWDAEFEHRATDLLLQIIGDVPVLLLECRPNREAVELTRDTIITL